MKYFVTGAAGFIGSNLVDLLLKKKHHVVGYDNLSTGQNYFLKNAYKNKNFKLIKGDLLNHKKLEKYLDNKTDCVIHLAANADVKDGAKFPKRDLEQNLLGTHNLLEAMRKKNIKKILFSSTGSIYGEAKRIPTPENYEIPLQTSMYAASKFSAESFIQAYSEAYNIKSVIFRFVSVLGNRYTHGHVFDFYKKLSLNPKKLNVLGNGLQKKSYMHIDDCCEAVYYISKYKLSNKVEIFNLGFNGYCEVRDSVKWITNYLGLKPKIFYGKENKGWIGDNPFIFLDTKKINKLGWKPKKRIKESIEETLEYLVKNKWLLKRR